PPDLGSAAHRSAPADRRRSAAAAPPRAPPPAPAAASASAPDNGARARRSGSRAGPSARRCPSGRSPSMARGRTRRQPLDLRVVLGVCITEPERMVNMKVVLACCALAGLAACALIPDDPATVAAAN